MKNTDWLPARRADILTMSRTWISVFTEDTADKNGQTVKNYAAWSIPAETPCQKCRGVLVRKAPIPIPMELAKGKENLMKPILFLVVLFIPLIFSCTKVDYTAQPPDGMNSHRRIKTAGQIEVISKLERAIITNLSNGEDIDINLNYDEINKFINSYSMNSNSIVVSVYGKYYDLLVITDLLRAYNNILTYWENLKQDTLKKIIYKHINSKINNPELNSFLILDALSYYTYQSEMSNAFFLYLFERFSIKNDITDITSAPELTISIPPLKINAVQIDDMYYDSFVVNLLQESMKEQANLISNKMRSELTEVINTQYDICVSNIDAYLDWYYSVFTGVGKTWEMITGALNPNKTAVEALQEYMVKNYSEKIGAGSYFKQILDILEQYKQKMVSMSIIYSSTLLDCGIDNLKIINIKEHITGDEYFSSFQPLPEYLNNVVSEGLPLIGFGNRLDTEGIIALDMASLVINFIPGVGFIAGTAVDIINMKIQEQITRPQFKTEITESIRQSQSDLLRVISQTEIGGN